MKLQVKGYFARFMEALPDVRSLAEADEAQVLKLWEGLGYYSRARNLQKAAREVMARFGGEIPGTVEELLTLPGIGSYTAGAVASIAFGQQAPAVDGNVLRVLSRVLCREEDVLSPGVKKQAERELAAVLPPGRAGDFNQALMELGETVCLPGAAPQCGACPLGDICKAYQLGVEGSLPVRGQKKPRRVQQRTVFLLTFEGRVALSKRREEGLLAGLWELPGADGALDEEGARALLGEWGLAVPALTKLKKAKHVFSHLEWHMTAWAGAVAAPGGAFFWASGVQLQREVALPSAFKAYRGEIEKRVGL